MPHWIRTRRGRWLIALTALLALYAVLGFFAAPVFVRRAIEREAAAALQRPVVVERVRLNPFAFSAAIEGLRVTDRDGGELASWRRAYADFDPLVSLFRWQWQLGEVQLNEPRQRLHIDKNGALNIADLLAPDPDAPPAPPRAGLPRIGVGELRVEQWELDFSDRSRAASFHTRLGPMTFTLTDFTTRPSPGSPYSFSGVTESGERFAWSGTVSANPLGSKGRIEVANLTLPKYAPFLADVFRGELRSGTLAAAATYEAALGETFVARASDASLSVTELAIAREPSATETAVHVREFSIALKEADLIARAAEISRIGVDGWSIRAERRADGSIDLLDLVALPAAQPPADGAAETGPTMAPDAGPAPSVRVTEIVVGDGRFVVTDRTLERAPTIVVDQISATIRGAGTDLNQEVGVESSLRWNESGVVSLRGAVRPQPLTAALEVEGAGLALAVADAYAAPWADVRIRDGALRFAGRLEAAQSPDGKLSAHWNGAAGIGALSVANPAGDELLTWREFALHGIDFQLDPLAVKIDDVVIADPVAHVAVAADGRINLQSIMRTAETAAAETPARAAEPAAPSPASRSERVAQATRAKLPFAAAIGAITFENARLTFRDDSVPGSFATELREFSGTIRGLSSENVARADVDLKGVLDRATLAVAGSINPLAEDLFSDVKVTLSSLGLARFSPYSGRFIGQTIRSGELRLELGYRLSKNVLEGDNRIVLDQFFLGDRVESPDALRLPVGLALALLRDRSGVITLDPPVRGSLDDPDFKYGRVVWHAIGNIIAKAATSPFSLLGSLIPGGGNPEDLAFVEFAPGVAELSAENEQKLAALETVLFERPALNLAIVAGPLSEADRAHLREQQFAALLSERVAAVTDASAGAEETAIRAWFAEKFPADVAAPAAAAESEATAAAAGPAAPDETERPNFLRRVWRSLRGAPDEPAAQPPPTAPAGPAAPADESAPPVAGPTLAEMRQQLLDTIEASEDAARGLATARVDVARERLVAAGKIEAERIRPAEESSAVADDGTGAKPGRVNFQLR